MKRNDMKYPLPLKTNKQPFITTPFGYTSPELIAWYKANGINIEAHNGTDIVAGNPKETYGTELICPFPEAQTTMRWYESPMSTKGNGIEIGYQNLKMLVWHCSEVSDKNYFKAGETMAYIGNSGIVWPAPTENCPYCGSHVHLMVYELINGIWELKDPMDYFELKAYGPGESPAEKDLPPLIWAVEIVKNRVAALVLAFNNWIKGRNN